MKEYFLFIAPKVLLVSNATGHFPTIIVKL